MTLKPRAPIRPRRHIADPRNPLTGTLAVLLSVLVHVAIALGLIHQSLGMIELPARERQFSLERIYDEVAMPPAIEESPLPDDEADRPLDELAELGMAMLEEQELLAERHEHPELPAPQMPGVEDERLPDPTETAGPDGLEDDPAAGLDRPETADRELAQLPDEALERPALDEGDGQGMELDTGPGGGAGGDGEGGGGEGEMAERAESLLDGARLSGGGLPAVAPPSAEPQPDTRPREDAAERDEPLPRLEPVEFGDDLARQDPDLHIPEHLDNDFEYRVTVYQPEGEEAGGYFRVDITPRRTLQRLAVMNKDVIYLIDTSGSVPQEWVDEISQGVSDALGALNRGDRFNIAFFSDRPIFLNPEGPVEATNDNLLWARRFLREGKSEGWTDLNQALSRLLVSDVDPDRTYNLVFISDGVPTQGVLNTPDLINLITRDNDGVASIYAVAAGERRFQNRELLDFLAYRNKGFTAPVANLNQMATRIRELASRIRFPIIKDVHLGVVGAGEGQTFPKILPNIHRGETFSVFGRFDSPDEFTMRLSGRAGEQRYDFTFTRDLTEAARGGREVARGWAFSYLHHLYSEMIEKDGDAEADLRDEIRHLRREYGLRTVYD